MKTNKATFAILVCLLSGSFLAKSQERDQLTVPLSDPNKEGKVKVEIITGSIKVVGYDGKDIIIDAVSVEKSERRTNRERPERSDGMKRISTNSGFELTAKENNNSISVGIDKVNMNVNITMRVPRKCSLKLSTVNNGDIDVENVNGNLEVSNINGNIRMKNIAGSVVANTINDDIVVNFTTITPNTPMAFTSLNGNVDVTFPSNINANVKLKSDMGEVYSDFDIDVDKTPSKINHSADKDKGLYKIKKDEWTYGKINGGGAEIMMKTFNSDIFIRKAK
jgi:hypothetical protein